MLVDVHIIVRIKKKFLSLWFDSFGEATVKLSKKVGFSKNLNKKSIYDDFEIRLSLKSLSCLYLITVCLGQKNLFIYIIHLFEHLTNQIGTI